MGEAPDESRFSRPMAVPKDDDDDDGESIALDEFSSRLEKFIVMKEIISSKQVSLLNLSRKSYQIEGNLIGVIIEKFTSCRVTSCHVFNVISAKVQ